MIPQYSVETIMLGLFFLMGMLTGGVLSVIVQGMKESRLRDLDRRD